MYSFFHMGFYIDLLCGICQGKCTDPICQERCCLFSVIGCHTFQNFQFFRGISTYSSKNCCCIDSFHPAGIRNCCTLCIFDNISAAPDMNRFRALSQHLCCLCCRISYCDRLRTAHSRYQLLFQNIQIICILYCIHCIFLPVTLAIPLGKSGLPLCPEGSFSGLIITQSPTASNI